MPNTEYRSVLVIDHTNSFVGIRDGSEIDLIHKSEVVGDLPAIGTEAFLVDGCKLMTKTTRLAILVESSQARALSY